MGLNTFPGMPQWLPFLPCSSWAVVVQALPLSWLLLSASGRGVFSDATPCCVIDSAVVLVALPVPLRLLRGHPGRSSCCLAASQPAKLPTVCQLLLQASEVGLGFLQQTLTRSGDGETSAAPAEGGRMRMPSWATRSRSTSPLPAQHLNGMLEQLFEKIYVVNAEISERMIADDQATSQPAGSIMATAQPGARRRAHADASQVSIQPQGPRERGGRWPGGPKDPSRVFNAVIQERKSNT